MKSFKLYLSLLLIMALGAVSCSDNFDAPPLNVPVATIKANTTLLDFKEMYWQDGTNYVEQITPLAGGEDIIISGRVISSDESGNIYKSLVIQDETCALAMSINANSLYTSYRVGQEIVINLNEMYGGKYAALFQLGYPSEGSEGAGFMPLEVFQQHAQVNGLPEISKIDTLETKITDLAGTPAYLKEMQSQLVIFKNVHWTEVGVVYADYQVNTNRYIADESGNQLLVRNSGYAGFRAELTPDGVGDVAGILSYYNGTWQLLLRSLDDVIGFSPAPTEGTKADPYTVEAAIALQGQGKSGWVEGYIVGAVAPGVTDVKSNSDIEWKAGTVLDNTIVLAPSADIKEIGKCLIVQLPEGSALRAAVNLETNPSVYQKALKLTGNLEMFMGQSGIMSSGSTSDFVLEGAPSGDGDGTKESPYSVAQVISGVSGTGWTQGYIVGWVDGMTLADGAKFTVPATVSSNVLIAASAEETNYMNCVPVQLPSGSVRSAINLQDNPANLGKIVKLEGSFEAYFGTKGLKSVTDYVIEGSPEPPVGPTDPVTSLLENFTSGIPSSWKNIKVTGDKEWYKTAFGGVDYAAMTGYKGTAPFDSWLITCPLDLNGASTKMFSFETQVNGYASTTTQFEVYVMTTNDPSTAMTTKLNPTIATAPASGYSSWVSSGDLDLSSFSGTVYVGFRYYATTDANYATWCVTKVAFGGNAGDGGDTGGGDTGGGDVDTSTSADFNTLNGGVAKGTYGTYTTTQGWTATNCNVLTGGATTNNPVFEFIGFVTGSTTEYAMAACMNGKTETIGTIVSPTIANGCGTLTFDYGVPYNETAGCSFRVDIKQNGSVVKTFNVTNEGAVKETKYSISESVNVSGDFTIEFTNLSPTSTSGSNKDRVAIWNVSWTNN